MPKIAPDLSRDKANFPLHAQRGKLYKPGRDQPRRELPRRHRGTVFLDFKFEQRTNSNKGLFVNVGTVFIDETLALLLGQCNH